jgi:hypothetical protein
MEQKKRAAHAQRDHTARDQEISGGKKRDFNAPSFLFLLPSLYLILAVLSGGRGCLFFRGGLALGGGLGLGGLLAFSGSGRGGLRIGGGLTLSGGGLALSGGGGLAGLSDLGGLLLGHLSDLLGSLSKKVKD